MNNLTWLSQAKGFFWQTRDQALARHCSHLPASVGLCERNDNNRSIHLLRQRSLSFTFVEVVKHRQLYILYVYFSIWFCPPYFGKRGLFYTLILRGQRNEWSTYLEIETATIPLLNERHPKSSKFCEDLGGSAMPFTQTRTREINEVFTERFYPCHRFVYGTHTNN